MRVVDVNDWFEEHQVALVELMKINIEGGEFELLERMIERKLVDRVRDFQLQFHNIAPDSRRRMKAIQSRLAEAHSLSYQYSFVCENWSRNSDNVRS